MKGDALLKHIPVIVLSGLGQANEAKLLNEGAGAFLMKSDTDSGGAKPAHRTKPSRVSSVRIRPLLPDFRFWVPGRRK